MIIGAHCGKTPRSEVQWDCFQTHYGNPKSLNTPLAIYNGDREREETPIWFWHAAFVAAARPNWGIRKRCGEYLQEMLSWMGYYKIRAVVLHTGRVVGQTPKEILWGINSFFDEFKLDQEKIAIELGASNCSFNRNPEYLIENYNWCLDLAHTNAAGCNWEQLWSVIEKRQPLVVHCNYPGSAYGSGLDIHGSYCHPKLRKDKSRYYNDNNVKEYFEETIRRLTCPLIIEGSGFEGFDLNEEMNKVKGIQ